MPELDPLSPEDRDVLRLFTYNGHGRTLLGYTRPDSAGGRFATVWEVAYGLPLRPYGRFYLFEGRSLLQASESPIGHQSLISTQYGFRGKTGLKPAEILGTYVWGWLLCPAAAALSLWLVTLLYPVIEELRNWPDILMMPMFLIWLAMLLVVPVGVLMGMSYLRSRYQRL
jgi:hypothetical protein